MALHANLLAPTSVCVVSDRLTYNCIACYNRQLFLCHSAMRWQSQAVIHDSLSVESMSPIKRVVFLALVGSVGLTLLMLACALPVFGPSWWPLFVIIFYLIAPLPMVIARRCECGSNVAMFLTGGAIASAYALPLLLVRAPVPGAGGGIETIRPAACALVLAGNSLVFLMGLGFFLFEDEDSIWPIN